MSPARIFPSVREAIHAVASTGRLSMKQVAAELDWAPSELSMRTTLGGESARSFPADDGRLVKLMKAQGDYSPLATMAAECGFTLEPTRARTAEIIAEAKAEVASALKKIQLAFDLDDQRQGKGRGR